MSLARFGLLSARGRTSSLKEAGRLPRPDQTADGERSSKGAPPGTCYSCFFTLDNGLWRTSPPPSDPRASVEDLGEDELLIIRENRPFQFEFS